MSESTVPEMKVKAFSIQGRLYRERERLTSMTDKERAWRKQWVRDQVLSHCEPKEVPDIYKELNNPIKRFYKAPMNALERAMVPRIGTEAAFVARRCFVTVLWGIVGVYAATYYFKYNAHDWTRKGGWRVMASRPAVLPGHPDYPAKDERFVGADYASRGFKNSPI